MPAGAPNPLAPDPPMRRTGRRTTYKPEYAEIARKLVDILGSTDQQIADFFGKSTFTIWNWKLHHPDFREAVELTPERANKIMERSLFLRGTGYSHPAVKIFLPAGAKKPVIVPYTEYYPPDTGAAALWLSNRNPKKWKNRYAPPEDAPPPGAAQEADRKRREGFATMMAIIEDRVRRGEPPIFAKPQAQIIDQAPRSPEAPLAHKGNGKGNGKP